MSGYDNYSDLFDGDGREHQDGSGLRKQLEEVLAQNRKLVERLESQERQEQLTALFKEKGKDPAAVALVPQGVDPKDWLDKNAAFLADAKKEEAKVEDQTKDAPPAAPEVPDPALDQERMAMETLAGLQGTGIPSTASADPIEKMKSFENEADLLAFIQSQGGTA